MLLCGVVNNRFPIEAMIPGSIDGLCVLVRAVRSDAVQGVCSAVMGMSGFRQGEGPCWQGIKIFRALTDTGNIHQPLPRH